MNEGILRFLSLKEGILKFIFKKLVFNDKSKLKKLALQIDDSFDLKFDKCE